MELQGVHTSPCVIICNVTSLLLSPSWFFFVFSLRPVLKRACGRRWVGGWNWPWGAKSSWRSEVTRWSPESWWVRAAAGFFCGWNVTWRHFDPPFSFSTFVLLGLFNKGMRLTVFLVLALLNPTLSSTCRRLMHHQDPLLLKGAVWKSLLVVWSAGGC